MDDNKDKVFMPGYRIKKIPVIVLVREEPRQGEHPRLVPTVTYMDWIEKDSNSEENV